MKLGPYKERKGAELCLLIVRAQPKKQLSVTQEEGPLQEPDPAGTGLWRAASRAVRNKYSLFKLSSIWSSVTAA